MTNATLDVATLTAGMVTDADAKRLAALGISVAKQPPTALPLPSLPRRSLAVLAADFGTAGVLLGASDPFGAHVDPLYRSDLVPYVAEFFDQRTARELPPTWGIEHYLMIFEQMGASLEATTGIPRVHMGSVWAMHCVLAAPPIGRPRHVKYLAKAAGELVAAGVPPRLFYETLQIVEHPHALERAVAASVFRHANPDVHTSLVRELF